MTAPSTRAPHGIEHEGLSVLEPQAQVGGLGERRAVDGPDGDGERDLVVFGRRQVGEHGAEGDAAALVGLERGVPERVQPAAAHGDPGDEEHRREADGERQQPGRRGLRRRAAPQRHDHGRRRAGHAQDEPPPRRPDGERQAEAAAVGGGEHVQWGDPAQHSAVTP